MNDEIILSPFGTARELHLGVAADEGITKLLRKLSLSCRDFNVESEMVQLAFEAAQWEPGLQDRERQAVLLMVLCSLIMQQQGSTRVPLRDEQGVARVMHILKTLLPPGRKDEGSPHAEEVISIMRGLIEEGKLRTILGSEGEFKPFIYDGATLYHSKMLQLEKRIVDKLLRIISREQQKTPGAVIVDSVLPGPGRMSLENEQKKAVEKAVTSSFCIITGGPGTGKTTVVISILRSLLKQGTAAEAIALAAPTGKAANRMGMSIQQALALPDPVEDAIVRIAKPRTLHRLLGYSPSRDSFRHHRNNPLSEEVIIIDEASMIDLFLVERLLDAVSVNSRVILIGDAEQLPSVDAGAVFKDLVSADRGYAAKLEISHRMKQEGAGKIIYSIAQAVRSGAAEELFDRVDDGDHVQVRINVSDLQFNGVELYDAAQGKRGILSFLDAWEQRFFLKAEGNRSLSRIVYPFSREGFAADVIPRLDRIFADIDRCKILGLTRAYHTGVDAVNEYFHARALRACAADSAGDREFLPGEPVMMLHNDYEKQVFNGDQGVVLNVRDENGVMLPRAIFRQGVSYTAFRLDSLRGSLAHSYAITVHKSQGSEYDHVALILPDQEIPILTRELIYTGVTRSRQSVSIIGNSEILKTGVRQRMVRFSGIAGRIAKGRDSKLE